MSQNFVYAGRLERLFAYLIDSVILIVPSALVVSLFHNEPVLTLVTFIASALYSIYFTASHWQATPGKRLLGLYVIHADRQPLSVRDATERFLAVTIPSLPLYASFIPERVSPMLVSWLSMFWFAPILFTAERIGLHDRLCNTRVLTGKAG